MNSGMLWYDGDDKKLLSDKINEASARYYEKFGVRPNVCYANRENLKSFAKDRDPLTYKMPCAVKPSDTIIRNHIWLGVEK